MDSDQRARGVPNYLFSVALTPDGRQAWVPGKKDNIVRGKLRDGRDLTHDTTVRPLAAVIDTQAAQEIYASRVDLDDRSQPVHVEFSPFGNFAILTLAGSNRVEIRDVNRPTQVFSAIGDVGAFPRAAVLAPDGRLFVQGALSRNVLVYDLSAMLDGPSPQSTPALLADIPTVASEKLPAQILAGKKIFHDAEDTRMAFEGYMSCGACHFEGDRRRPRLRFQHPRRGAAEHAGAARPQGDRTRPPQLVRHARRGAGLRAPDPRPVRRHAASCPTTSSTSGRATSRSAIRRPA